LDAINRLTALTNSVDESRLGWRLRIYWRELNALQNLLQSKIKH